MHDSQPKTWRAWRVTPATRKDSAPLSLPPQRQNLVGELPGPDGIRWGLVNRIRAEIAAGTYDSEAKFAEAEERLLARLSE